MAAAAAHCCNPTCSAGAEAKTLRCGRCKAAHYCSKSCQAAHWTAGHKDKCVTPENHTAAKASKTETKGEPRPAPTSDLSPEWISRDALTTFRKKREYEYKQAAEFVTLHGVFFACAFLKALDSYGGGHNTGLLAAGKMPSTCSLPSSNDDLCHTASSYKILCYWTDRKDTLGLVRDYVNATLTASAAADDIVLAIAPVENTTAKLLIARGALPKLRAARADLPKLASFWQESLTPFATLYTPWMNT